MKAQEEETKQRRSGGDRWSDERDGKATPTADCHNENIESVEGRENPTEDCVERSLGGARRNVCQENPRGICDFLVWTSLSGSKLELELWHGSPTLELNDLPRTALAFKILFHAFCQREKISLEWHEPTTPCLCTAGDQTQGFVHGLTALAELPLQPLFLDLSQCKENHSLDNSRWYTDMTKAVVAG